MPFHLFPAAKENKYVLMHGKMNSTYESEDTIMTCTSHSFTSADGATSIQYFVWPPKSAARGVMQISHGMCEYMGRYDEMAEFLTRKGFVVCGLDHLGHGESVGEKDTFGYFGKKYGPDFLVEDQEKLHRIMTDLYPDAPYIMYGHSMGSFIARLWYEKYGNDISAVIFSGTATANPLATPLKGLAHLSILLRGDRKPADFIGRTMSKVYTSKIEKVQTNSDWISHDSDIVKKYVNDPFCNYTFTDRGYIDLFTMLARCNRKKWFAKIPKDKPMLLLSGTEDPVGDYGKGVMIVTKKLQESGQNRLIIDLRSGMRHEPHNEINRKVIYQRLEAFLVEVVEKNGKKSEV